MIVINGLEYSRGKHVIDGEIIIVIDDKNCISKGPAPKELTTRVAEKTINLNTASGSDLESIEGISKGLAVKIIASSPYENVDELLEIKGIGPKLLENNKQYFVV